MDSMDSDSFSNFSSPGIQIQGKAIFTGMGA